MAGGARLSAVESGALPSLQGDAGGASATTAALPEVLGAEPALLAAAGSGTVRDRAACGAPREGPQLSGVSAALRCDDIGTRWAPSARCYSGWSSLGLGG